MNEKYWDYSALLTKRTVIIDLYFQFPVVYVHNKDPSKAQHPKLPVWNVLLDVSKITLVHFAYFPLEQTEQQSNQTTLNFVVTPFHQLFFSKTIVLIFCVLIVKQHSALTDTDNELVSHCCWWCCGRLSWCTCRSTIVMSHLRWESWKRFCYFFLFFWSLDAIFCF